MYYQIKGIVRKKPNELTYHCVAICALEVVAYGKLEIKGETGYLSELFVEPDYRGLGIGKALQEHREEKARMDFSCIQTALRVRQDTIRHSIYQDRGYKIIMYNIEEGIDLMVKNIEQ